MTVAPASRSRIRGRRARIRALLPAFMLLLLSACALQPASDNARGVKTLYQITFAVAAVIFVVVGGAIVWFAIRYRHRPGDDDLPAQIHGNTKAEVAWTVIPSIIVLFLFILSALELGHIDRAEAGAMTIDITGFQWQWQFGFPDYKTSSGNPLTVQGLSGQTARLPVLYLPLGQPVHFHLESGDVIHSFFIPNFLFKRDVIPGHPNDFDLTPDRAGTFPGKCAEFCGLYHSRMLFTVKIVPKPQFTTWAIRALAAQQKKENECRTASGGALQIAAQSIHFDTACMQAPAGQPFKIQFDNKDSGIEHDVAIFTNSSLSQKLFAGQLINGPATVTYDVAPLQAGTYYFHCDVHPAMNGTFRVR